MEDQQEWIRIFKLIAGFKKKKPVDLLLYDWEASQVEYSESSFAYYVTLIFFLFFSK